MAPVMVADESSDSGRNSQDVEESSAKSEDTEPETQLDDDDYNTNSDGESDCSVTSCMNINQENDIAAWDINPPAPTCTELVPLTADSEDTAWTDDKHSSYLDCIEATFVRKMYDKEYCSVDVCGHSSHSSVTWDQDSVESRPLFLNMRKPTGQVPVGLLPFKDRSRPWLLAPSVLASPWIQHFKSRQSTTAKLPEMKDKSEAENVELLSASEPAGLLHKPVLDSDAAIHSSCTATTKRGFSSGITDCRISVAQSVGYNKASHNNFSAGRFKKLKCQQALSQLDMEMEEQFNSKQQQTNICPMADGQHTAVVQEKGNVSEQCMINQMDGNEGTAWQLTREKVFQVRLDTCSKPAKESLTCKKLDQLDHNALNQVNQNAKESSTCKKLDQVVPFEDAGSDEASGQNVVPQIELMQNSKHSSESKELCVDREVDDVHISVEQGISRTSIVNISGQTEKDTSTSVDPTEPERFTAVSGSKTWTWGIKGTRHQHLNL